MSETNINTPGAAPDCEADQLTRVLDLELQTKRAQWKRASVRNRNIRSAGILFFVVLAAVCAVALIFLFSQAMEQRNSAAAAAAHTP
jgi:hypothetical protein